MKTLAATALKGREWRLAVTWHLGTAQVDTSGSANHQAARQVEEWCRILRSRSVQLRRGVIEDRHWRSGCVTWVVPTAVRKRPGRTAVALSSSAPLRFEHTRRFLDGPLAKHSPNPEPQTLTWHRRVRQAQLHT